MTDESERTMPWHAGAERILDALCGMVPDTLRELAELAARQETEFVAAERGGDTVLADDVIRGWIRTTPPEQRNSLIAVIEQLGFEPADFADELQSELGWEEPDDSER